MVKRKKKIDILGSLKFTLKNTEKESPIFSGKDILENKIRLYVKMRTV